MNSQDNILIDAKQTHNIANSAGLNFSIFDNGEIENINCEQIQINLITGTPIGSGCCNIYLRKRSSNQFAVVPLIGSTAHGKQFIEKNNYIVKGQFDGINFACRLLLCENSNSWLWSVELFNTNNKIEEVDLIAVQDVGLSCANGNEQNDFYISQYVDYKSLEHKEHGLIICCRQNEHGPDNYPWLAFGSTGKVVSYSTDGTQFFGQNYRATAKPVGLMDNKLSGLLQREFALVALQSEPMLLRPSEKKETGFFGIFNPDHPKVTTENDLNTITSELQQIKKLITKPWPQTETLEKPVASLFSETPLFTSEELSDGELDSLFGPSRKNCEIQDGKLLSFFCNDNHHVALGCKELIVNGPHGHIMKTENNLVPDDATMSCSCYMFGVFLSHLAQGNVNYNRFLTVNTNALNVIRHTGTRIFIQQADQYYQLAVPSAFEMSINQCKWIYKQGQLLFEIVCRTEFNCPKVCIEMNILKGSQQEWLISNNLTPEHDWQIESNEKNQFSFLPKKTSNFNNNSKDKAFDICFDSQGLISQIGGDEILFTDGQSRDLKFFVISMDKTNGFEIQFQGWLAKQKSLSEDFNANKNNPVSLDFLSVKQQKKLSPLSQILPWFIHNANIHYLTPHGLEQYGGAAWGTRDICQGPIEMLLAQGNYAAVRWILCKIFSNQNENGNWPQWWMFDKYNDVRAKESHGDVIFWPILALSEYISTSGDYDFLDTFLPYYNENAFIDVKQHTVMDHVLCAFEHIKATRFSDGTMLVNYSDGDWNDAMQPANPELKKKMISSWTVGLSYQALSKFANICQTSSRNEVAEEIVELCKSIRKDFNRLLIKDDVVAGFALIEKNECNGLLLHPLDSTTGIKYRLLPMIRGIISDIFTPTQAKLHAELIEKHLKGPDGARLMDRPPCYDGGMQKFFKRAESSPYFGREIGIMYVHAHLRYAEALAHMGDSKRFIKALLQVVPIEIQQIVPQANRRQSNCYYSSSDADFKNRYEANEHYEDLKAGKISLRGGWRIYSSGPGMFVNLIISYLLGIRHRNKSIIFDPVMTSEFDGVIARLDIADKNTEIIYSVNGKNKGLRQIIINGKDCDYKREVNPYRLGGAVVDYSKLTNMLNHENNTIKIYL